MPAQEADIVDINFDDFLNNNSLEQIFEEDKLDSKIRVLYSVLFGIFLNKKIKYLLIYAESDSYKGKTKRDIFISKTIVDMLNESNIDIKDENFVSFIKNNVEKFLNPFIKLKQ